MKRKVWHSFSFASLALAGLLASGCSRVHITRTINADGSAIDECRLVFTEKGLASGGASMEPQVVAREIGNVMERLGSEKTMVGDASLGYQGEVKYTVLVEHAGKAGLIFESEDWLRDQKAFFEKQADGGINYELPVDFKTLEKAMTMSGLLAPPQGEDGQPIPEPEPEEGNAPPPLFPMLGAMGAKPNGVPGEGQDAKIEQAWKALEYQVDVVMPGPIKNTNAKSFKDRTATWILKPYELMQEAAKQKPDKGGKTKAAFVLKASCGPAVPAAKADEDRFKKLKGQ